MTSFNKVIRRASSYIRVLNQPKLLSIAGLIVLIGLNPNPTQTKKTAVVNPAVSVKTQKIYPIRGFSEPVITIKVTESEAEKKKREDEERSKQEAANVQPARSREVVDREAPNRSSGPSFDEKRAIVQRIASENGIDWKILEAVWQVESGKSWDTTVRSYAGAQGPMQFLPSTFRKYAPGGNIHSAVDSLNAGARLLASAGAASGDVDRALFAYNHSSSYVSKVKSIAASIN